MSYERSDCESVDTDHQPLRSAHITRITQQGLKLFRQTGRCLAKQSKRLGATRFATQLGARSLGLGNPNKNRDFEFLSIRSHRTCNRFQPGRQRRSIHPIEISTARQFGLSRRERPPWPVAIERARDWPRVSNVEFGYRVRSQTIKRIQQIFRRVKGRRTLELFE